MFLFLTSGPILWGEFQVRLCEHKFYTELAQDSVAVEHRVFLNFTSLIKIDDTGMIIEYFANRLSMQALRP